MKKTLVAATAACAILAGGGAAAATDFNPFSEDAKTTAGTQLTSTVDGQLGPGQELLIAANCPGTRANLTTSWGATTVMSPAADLGQLVGYVTAPDNIGPGPADGYHTYTVTCDSGETDTFTFASGGNGGH
ncbi:hypothetical protein HMPREF3158_12225 [Corynebacterium sp. HMSC06G04]|uniref:hypothetical protein n=1 Tax=Corynebacterium sp. HMSC06G04 TaxID=1581126 RepID=UPI0008C9F7D7|nr:hypothetical protein [Corynebacterium sp. HMSC06G04]OFT44225.1 hypothetical protein HMPREF3158_12225 [Corynebacterium sp. HMSC06G04]